MKYLLGSILVSMMVIGTNLVSDDIPITSFTASDSVNIEVEAHYDSLGLLEIYSARISTPVCEGSKCYTIEIDFYWDCIGRFHHYDSISGKGLTKLDHIPFTASDYRKLDAILHSPNSLLASYSNEELVKDTRSSAIDGITCATKNEIKESVIGGAVYSCHTLWHIAHGQAVDSIQSTTQQLFSKDLIQKLVSGEDQGINYFLVSSFSAHEFSLYLPEVLRTIENGKGYYAKNAIEKMPAEILNSSEVQGFFATNFGKLDYFAQIALLEKLKAELLSIAMKDTLAEEMDERDSYKNDLIKSLISND